MTRCLGLIMILLAAASTARAQLPAAEPSSEEVAHWYSSFSKHFRKFGHRNWIAIVDSAYPEQTSPGIETMVTGADQLRAVELVLGAFAHRRHVRPIIYLDAELQHVPESDAPGIEKYRADLDGLLAAHAVNHRPHAQLIQALDEASQNYRVLVLKTNLELPYTSVFIELDCGYWSAEAEARLREAIKSQSD